MIQMYGEKVEEADELRLDLQDVKKMYKDQVSLNDKRTKCLYIEGFANVILRNLFSYGKLD